MGIVSRLVDEDNNRSTEKYAELTDEDLKDSKSETDIVFVDVKDKGNLTDIKRAVQRGNIVFADISYIESNGMPIELIHNELNQVVKSNEGDIVHKKRNNTIIVSPSGINIQRKKI
jgi:SepF-like predicted cell division protein (DUF552 family)